MTTDGPTAANLTRQAIRAKHATIYDPPSTASTGLFYTPEELQALLSDELIGSGALADLAVRSRSKVAKRLVCEALGYDAPTSFKKVNPRLPHPNIDVYSQQSSNLQVWNQEIDASRRYVILILKNGYIRRVEVIAGANLAQYDTTGALTSKYQANRIDEQAGSFLASPTDTERFVRILAPSTTLGGGVSPVATPLRGHVLDIQTAFRQLLPLVGKTFVDPGATKERTRGALVHQAACHQLGLSHYADNGQFPDILSQLIEIKLQLARTIDLGLELPDSDSLLASTNSLLAVSDIRYAIFYAARSGTSFTITGLVVVTGQDFFKEFRQFKGNVTNSKLQLRLPGHWFS